MAGNATKKSFDLRMSKKVAELTQVVHMLFMKHHEKELELEALKDAYEHEIDLVIADAKSQLDKLTRELQERELRLKAKPEKEKENAEDQMKIQALEKSLQAEKAESQSVRDLLILSEKDIETLRTLNAEELSRHSSEMSEKSKEIDLLKFHVADLERLTQYSESQTSHVVDSLRKAVEKLRGETVTLREELSNSENLRETLTNRNKNLEDDVRRLKRQLARRSSLPDVDNAKQQTAAANTDTFSRKPNYDREIQRLNQEIQRYRMELSNRETNYNRRFADMQPIIVNRRPVSGRTPVVVTNGGQSSKNAEQLNGHRGDLLQSSAYVGRERAVTGRELREVTHQSYSDDLVSSSLSVSPSIVRSTSSTTSERLPQLDAKLTIRRPVLAKPQPSKLLISRKSNWTTSHV